MSFVSHGEVMETLGPVLWSSNKVKLSFTSNVEVLEVVQQLRLVIFE